MRQPVERGSVRRDRGASSVEYAILVSLIAIVIIAAVSYFGTQTNGLFQKTCSSLASSQSTTC